MKVRALELGFYGATRRKPGSVFDIKEGELGRWMEPVDAEPAAEEKPAKPAKAAKPQKQEPAPAVSTGDQDVI